MLQTGKPRGVVILFGVFVVVILLAVGGLAIDVGSMLTERSELHRATDAGALAGAGNLGLDASAFPAVRAAAVDFGSRNPSRYGPVNLDPNWSNAANGDVVLGIWNAGTFTPSLDGSVVNAVQCRTSKTFPTSFLRIIGLNSLNMSAYSIAVSNPINVLEGKCPFPVGMSACSFFNADGLPSSDGCGRAVTFISSTSNPGSNTAAWVNLEGTDTPTPPYLGDALAAAANGTGCSVSDPPEVGDDRGVNNGMVQSALDDAEKYYKLKWADGTIHTVTRNDGTTVYKGPGWEVYVPLIETDCPVAGPISGDRGIKGFARFVITQVVNHGVCAEDPSTSVLRPTIDQDKMFTSQCSTGDPNYRAILGYFDCNIDFKAAPGNGGPRAVLSDRMRLVR